MILLSTKYKHNKIQFHSKVTGKSCNISIDLRAAGQV